MNRIRIMHVVDSLGTGGTEEGIRKVLSGLDKAVFEQTVCTVVPCKNSETAGGARVVSVLKPQGRRRMLVGPFKRMFELERPDIVHSRNWGAIEAIVAARLGGVRGVVHSEHGLESSTYRGQPLRRNAIRRFSFAWTDRVFAVSRALRAYYVQQLRIAEERIGVIPNGVDTDHFRPRPESHLAATEGWRASSSTTVIGTVGRLDPVKDHYTLVNAIDLLFAMGVDVHLVIVGGGPEREALEARTQNRHSCAAKVTFVGETRNVASYLNSFDIFVLPSLAEGMSNALLEAMSSGVACVASRVGGNSELIEEGSSGLLFDVGDAKVLADRLKMLALNPQYRQNLGENARKRVEKSFSLHRMMHNYTRLYTDLVANRRSSFGFSNNRIAAQPEFE
jgi:sugar transferase (PEP-CTERM/EpsH1 system associated)